MKELLQTTKSQIEQLIKNLLLSINGVVKKFEDGYEMKIRTKHGDDSWREWTETIYCVVVESNLGEISLRFSLGKLSWVDSIGEAIHNSLYSNEKLFSVKEDILEKLYSRDFMELQNKYKKKDDDLDF
ncbi:MAG: hypothetical protein WC458_02055 [Patescibacteria group bacterium]|jgi:hypothetical protein